MFPAIEEFVVNAQTSGGVEELTGQSGVQTSVESTVAVPFDAFIQNGHRGCGFGDWLVASFQFAIFFSLDLNSDLEHIHRLDNAGGGHAGDTTEHKWLDCGKNI